MSCDARDLAVDPPHDLVAEITRFDHEHNPECDKQLRYGQKDVEQREIISRLRKCTREIDGKRRHGQ